MTNIGCTSIVGNNMAVQRPVAFALLHQDTVHNHAVPEHARKSSIWECVR